MFDIPIGDLMELTHQSQLNYKPRSTFMKTGSGSLDSAFNNLNVKNLPNSLSLDECTAKLGTQAKEFSQLCEKLYKSVTTHNQHYAFVTFSAPYSMAQCPSHIHHLVDGQPCMTTTFSIPLYCGKIQPEFCITPDSVKRPTRWHLDPYRISPGLHYLKIASDPNNILKFEFNSSFKPHYVTYTDSVVAWLVIDGSVHSEDLLVTTMSAS